MSTYGLFNNSEDNTEAEFLRHETSFLAGAGVIDLDGGDLEVTADGSTLNAYVAAGGSRISNSGYSANSGETRFYQAENTAPVTVSISANSDGNPRIASIFQRFNASANPTTRGQGAIEYAEVTGTAAASPTAPAAPSDGNSYLRLANITVSNGAGSISNSDISDERVQSFMEGSQVRASNDSYIKGEDAAGSSVDILGVDASDHTSIKAKSGKFVKTQVRRLNAGTGAYQSDTVQIYGYGAIVGDGSNRLSETVNFGVTFTSAPVIVCNYYGVNAGAGGSASTAHGGGTTINANAINVSTTGFDAYIYRSDGSVMSAPTTFNYSFTVFGQV